VNGHHACDGPCQPDGLGRTPGARGGAPGLRPASGSTGGRQVQKWRTNTKRSDGRVSARHRGADAPSQLTLRGRLPGRAYHSPSPTPDPGSCRYTGEAARRTPWPDESACSRASFHRPRRWRRHRPLGLGVKPDPRCKTLRRHRGTCRSDPRAFVTGAMLPDNARRSRRSWGVASLRSMPPSGGPRCPSESRMRAGRFPRPHQVNVCYLRVGLLAL
jgi:hypothetical protein